VIKSLAQAIATQKRRAAQQKRGYAKAVRRFLKRNHASEYLKERGKLEVFWVPEKAEGSKADTNVSASDQAA
jgi:predicted AAA+ superfamily ATPase